MTKKEKFLSGIIAILLIIIVLGSAFVASEVKYCSNVNEETNNNTQSETGDYRFNEIDMPEYTALIGDSGKHVIYIGRPTCGYCVKQNPILDSVAASNNIVINYLDIDLLTSSEIQTLIASHESLEKLSTPSFIITENGKIIGNSIGYMEKTELETFFTKYGLM